MRALRTIAAAFLLWAIVVFVFICCLANAVSGQTTQPTTQPTLQVEMWQPGTPIVTGGRYVLPWKQPVNITVSTPGVQFYGGWVWAEGGTCVTVNRGGTGCTVVGVRFDKPNQPRDGRKLDGFKDCVITYAAGTRVLFCQVGTVDEFVKGLPGAENLVVDRCEDVNGDIRSAWVFMAGVKGARLTNNVFRESATENGFRMSPQGDQISSDVLIEGNDLANTHKACIDARHAESVVIRNNTVRNGQGDVPAVRLGDDQLPGCKSVVFDDNTVIAGCVHGHKNAFGTATANRFYDVPTGLNFLNFDASKIVPTGNVGYVRGPVPANAKRLPPGNRWEQQK